MKHIQKQIWKLLLCILSISGIFMVCRSETSMPSTYTFAHPAEKIESIELLKNDNIDAFSSDDNLFRIIGNLNAAEIKSFMSNIYEIETTYCISPPRRGYGEYIAKITYENGDIEMLGTFHIEYIPFGDNRTGVGAYYFVGDTMEQLILKYVT